jgi:hypothetical protein
LKDRGSHDVEAVVESLSVVVAEFPPGVTVAGENEQEALDGTPEHANETACPNEPYSGCRVKV